MVGIFTSFDQLPEDIIMEIFSILPVKSILKLKAVCKYWYLLIQTPNFIIKHFCHKTNHAILFVHIYFLDKNQLSLSNNESPLLQDFYLHKSTSLKPVIGPLNGLFFVHNLDKNEMALWNPATEEIKKITISSPPLYPSLPYQILQKYNTSKGSAMHPATFLKSSSNTNFNLCCSDSPEMLSHPCRILEKHTASEGSDTHPSIFLKGPSERDFRSYAHHFGFGMDPLSKDYKVVWIRDYFWKEETFTRSASAVVSVYRLSTDSWRHFEDTTFLSSHIVMSYFDSYLDGFYYWKKIDAEQNCEILAFDFRNETFQVIQTPDVFNSNLGTLGLYDGCVSMFFHFVVQSKTCIEIWVMERFGFWTKRLVLESPLIVKRPIGYGVKGEIFLETTSSSLTMIDPRTQEIAKFTEPLGNNGYSLQVLGYKKSLVSIKKLTSCNLTRVLEFEL
ncbi:F-box protein At5g10340-like [Lycium barbarum]|uniref:F-box protein At5g10340-like n=1 Tax=Lycium barbarum TaxID=112863 RepID=UPI00293EB4EF|nr:F-box protein At5g10340-like [Lycium barbarum]